MPNIYWYIGLAVIGLSIIIFTLYKKRNKYRISTLLVFSFFTASVTWIGEFIVLGLFNSYGYRTGLIQDIWAQNLIGHLLINTTLYPAVALVMVAYSLRYGWILFVATAFTLIEYLYVNLRIYEQHWWRYYMTFIVVIIVLSILSMWFDKMKRNPVGSTRAITYYFVAMLMTHMPAPLLLLLGKQHYQIGYINDKVGNLYLASIIIIFFYHLIECFLLVFCTCILKKWYWSLLPIVFSIAVQSILAKMNILVIAENWSLIYTLILYELSIVAYILFEKNTLKPTY